MEVSAMKAKTINLRAWMFLKAAPAALLLVYYWMCTREDFRPWYLYLQTAVFAAAGVLAACQIGYAKKREIFLSAVLFPPRPSSSSHPF